MIISENSYSKKIVTKKVDENLLEVVETIDLTHPECPVVVISSNIEIEEVEK